MTFFEHKRIEVWIALIVGAGALAAGSFMNWWNLYGAPQPGIFVVCRAISIGMLLLSAASFWKPALQRLALSIAAFGGLALPLFSVALLCLASPSTTYKAIQANIAADVLLQDIKTNDFSPYISWKKTPAMSMDRRLLDNQFTIVDGCESISYCLAGGWYLTIFGGALLLIGVWVGGPKDARFMFRNALLPYKLALIAILIFYGARAGVSALYWNKAREAHSMGLYREALDYDRQAVAWDRRLDYDLAFHYELGELFAKLGMTAETDYWAGVGDNYLNLSRYAEAYRIYRDHIHLPPGRFSESDSALSARYIDCLDQYAVSAMNTGHPQAALAAWNSAYNLDPDNIETMYRLAMAETYAGQYDQAIKQWRDVISLNENVGLFKYKIDVSSTYRKPITSRAWIKLAYCYTQKGDYKRAQICRDYSITASASSVRLLDE
jgi:hypothetical protein